MLKPLGKNNWVSGIFYSGRSWGREEMACKCLRNSSYPDDPDGRSSFTFFSVYSSQHYNPFMLLNWSKSTAAFIYLSPVASGHLSVGIFEFFTLFLVGTTSSSLKYFLSSGDIKLSRFYSYLPGHFSPTFLPILSPFLDWPLHFEMLQGFS